MISAVLYLQILAFVLLNIMRNITRSFTLLSPTDWQEDYFQQCIYFTTKITVPKIVITTIPRVTTIIGVNKRTFMVFKGCFIQKYHLHRGNSAALVSKVLCFVTSTSTLYSDYSECNLAIRIALKLLYFSKNERFLYSLFLPAQICILQWIEL